MDYACAWLAVKGTSVESLRADLAVHVASEAEQGFEDDICETMLSGGWHLFSAASWDERLIGDSVAERLSRHSDLVMCCVDELVMRSMAAGWKFGQCTWSLSHDPDHGVDHLECHGKLPDCFNAIADTHRKSQHEESPNSDTDYIFDVPIDVAASVTGYRYDADENDGRDYQVVVFNKSPSLWKRLLG